MSMALGNFFRFFNSSALSDSEGDVLCRFPPNPAGLNRYDFLNFGSDLFCLYSAGTSALSSPVSGTLSAPAVPSPEAAASLPLYFTR